MTVATVFAGCTQVGSGGDNKGAADVDGAVTPSLRAEPATDDSKSGDGPFGLNLTAGPSRLNIDQANSSPDKGLYILKSVPKPSSSFATYAVVAHDGVGVCEIRAVSPDFDGDTIGTKARIAADALAEALSSKYGKPEHNDTCVNTCDAQYWAMSLGDGERAYDYEWKPKGEKVPRSISLHLNANGITPYMRLDYETNDAEKCSAATKAAAAKDL